MKSDHILVSSTSSCTVTGTLCIVLEGKTVVARGLGTYLFHAMKHVKGP